jgi:hypothetical protein
MRQLSPKERKLKLQIPQATIILFFQRRPI